MRYLREHDIEELERKAGNKDEVTISREDFDTLICGYKWAEGFSTGGKKPWR